MEEININMLKDLTFYCHISNNIRLLYYYILEIMF